MKIPRQRQNNRQRCRINAGGGINAHAGHNATSTTALKGSFYEYASRVKEKTWFGLGSRTTTITHTNTDLTNSVANINGGGGAVNINAGNDVTIIGANINGAGGVNIHGGNNTNILAAYDIKEKIDTKTVKSNDFGRFMDTLKQSATNAHITPIHDSTDTYSNNIDSTRTAVLTNINGGSGNVSLTAGNTLNLQAPVINGGSFTYGGGNQTNLLAAIDSREISQSSGGRNFHWQVNQSQGSKTETLHMTQVNVPVGMTNFVGAGGISVQLPKGSSLATQIETLSKLPGNEYLADLANRKDIDWQQVDVINKTWDHKKEGLTQEAAIIVAIVVTIFTAGAASSAAGSIVGTAGTATATGTGLAAATGMSVGVAAATTTAVAAGITTLATQATIALINSQGDIGAALKELGSKENVKNLAVAMVTAGLVKGLGIEFGLDKVTAKSPFIDQLSANLVNSVTGSLVSTAINGGSLEQNLINAIKTGLISTAGAIGADAIGTATKDGLRTQTAIDKFANQFAHVVLGCALGAAQADSSAGCGAGALGAFAGNLGADLFDPTNSQDPIKKAQTQQFAKLTASLAVMLTTSDAKLWAIGGSTAVNAVANNRQLHPKEITLIQSKSDEFVARMKALGYDITPEQATRILKEQADNRVDANAAKTPDSETGNEVFKAEAQKFLNQIGREAGTFMAENDITRQFFTNRDAQGNLNTNDYNNPKLYGNIKPYVEGNISAADVAAGAAIIGRGAGIVSSTATAAVVVPGPHQPLAGTVMLAATGIDFVAKLVEQGMDPSMGKAVFEIFSTGASDVINTKAPLVAPLTNELFEIWKKTNSTQSFTKWVDEKWQIFRGTDK